MNTVTNTQPAYFGQGTKLTVLEQGIDVTPPTVEILKPSTKECKHKTDEQWMKTLVCVASDFYPDHVGVSWKVNGEPRTSGVASESAALRGTNRLYSLSSRLRVPVEDWENLDNRFTCVVTFFNGTTYKDYTDQVAGVAGNAPARDTYLKTTQTAKLAYIAFILKSCAYGAFVGFLVWKLKKSSRKQK